MAPLLELLAEKDPLVAVKSSNTTVSVSVGPAATFSVGGSGGGGAGAACTMMISGTEWSIDGSGGSELCAGGSSV